MRKAIMLLVLVVATLVIAANATIYVALRTAFAPIFEYNDRFANEAMSCSYELRGTPISSRHGVVSTWHADCMAADTIGFGAENREDEYDCAVLSPRSPGGGTRLELPAGQVLARSSALIYVSEKGGMLHVATQSGRFLERVAAIDGVPITFDGDTVP